jgi:hypothetical protein
MIRNVMLVLAAVLLSASGAAQVAPAPAAESAALTSKSTSVAGTFDPAKYGMATFGDPGQLYAMLTQAGRCPVKETAEPKQPCALIFYRPELTGTKQAFNFKPVFKVMSKRSMWAMHDGKLQKVSAEDLFWDAMEIEGVRHRYVSIAVIGNAENRANCAAQRLCLKDLVAEDMFAQWKKMPADAVSQIWGKSLEPNRAARLFPS